MKFNSEQEVFDAVVKHAEQMTKPSVNREFCCYRSEDGNKCLVGVLIEDVDYTSEMDNPLNVDVGTSVSCLANRGILPEYLLEYEVILVDCQKAHDRNREATNWKSCMIEDLKVVANNFNLKYNGIL